jgi:hypothetical protein
VANACTRCASVEDNGRVDSDQNRSRTRDRERFFLSLRRPLTAESGGDDGEVGVARVENGGQSAEHGCVAVELDAGFGEALG